MTEESVAGSYNNFYEFTTGKNVVPFISKFTSDPWTVEVAGLVGKPKIYDFDALLRKMPLEERLYRHRCVEAWAMAVPWDRISPESLHRCRGTAVCGQVRENDHLFQSGRSAGTVELP